MLLTIGVLTSRCTRKVEHERGIFARTHRLYRTVLSSLHLTLSHFLPLRLLPLRCSLPALGDGCAFGVLLGRGGLPLSRGAHPFVGVLP